MADPLRAPGAAALRFIGDFGRLTGTRVVFVDSNEVTPFFSGAVGSREPNTIFIHIRGARPIDALIGHEWGHTLEKQDPALYRQLQRIAFRYTDNWRLRARAFRNGTTYRTSRKWGVELTNNYLGDAFMDPDFWREVHSHVDSSLFRRAYRSVLDWFDRLMDSARTGFGTREFATDLAALRRQFAEMVAKAIRQQSPNRNGAPPARGDLDRMAAALDGDAEFHFARVGQTLRQAEPTMVEDVPEVGLLDTRVSNNQIAIEAAKVVQSWPRSLRAADGSMIEMVTPDRGSIAGRVFHLIRDADTHAIHLTKAAWLPRVAETLRNAQVRLIDSRDGTRVYVRKYKGGISHAVVVRPDGKVESQRAFEGSLTTQFPIMKITDPRNRQKYMEIDWVRPDIKN